MIDTFPFSSHFFKWGCSGLNFYVHGKSVDGMDVQGIFSRFFMDAQFVCKRNCGGFVKNLLKIAIAILSQEWKLRYLCTIKIKTGCYTIRVGNADEVYGFAIRNTEGKKLGDERSKLT